MREAAILRHKLYLASHNWGESELPQSTRWKSDFEGRFRLPVDISDGEVQISQFQVQLEASITVRHLA